MNTNSIFHVNNHDARLLHAGFNLFTVYSRTGLWVKAYTVYNVRDSQLIAADGESRIVTAFD